MVLQLQQILVGTGRELNWDPPCPRIPKLNYILLLDYTAGFVSVGYDICGSISIRDNTIVILGSGLFLLTCCV